MPRQKTVLSNLGPAAAALAVVGVLYFVIPLQEPVDITNGIITPEVARPGERVAVFWTQDWRKLCSIKVTREFVGSDGFKKIAASFVYEPPKKTGITPYKSEMVVPDLPAGQAYYHSVLEPNCLVDKLWQRSYKTPNVPLTIVAATPPGPR